MPSTKVLSLILLAIACLLAAGCGGGGDTAKQSLQPGTPPFYWAAAKQAYDAGDYPRASENIAKLTTSDNEFRARAAVWQLVLSAGMTKGYLEVAEAYDLGAKANKEKALAFRKQASAARTLAKGSLLQTLETVHYLNEKVKDAKLQMAFGNPTGRLAEIPNLTKVAKGVLPPEAEAEANQKTAVQKGVVWAATRMVGAGDDAAKAAEMFKQTPVEVPREQFLLGVAGVLAEHAELFGPKQLDEPQRLKIVCGEASEALKQAGTAKGVKDVDAKLQKLMKTVKAS